jgi:hypothetical protein
MPLGEAVWKTDPAVSGPRTPFSGPDSPQCSDDPKSYPVRGSDDQESVAIVRFLRLHKNPAELLWDLPEPPLAERALKYLSYFSPKLVHTTLSAYRFTLTSDLYSKYHG